MHQLKNVYNAKKIQLFDAAKEKRMNKIVKCIAVVAGVMVCASAMADETGKGIVNCKSEVIQAKLNVERLVGTTKKDKTASEYMSHQISPDAGGACHTPNLVANKFSNS
jgi:hypothetical protein